MKYYIGLLIILVFTGISFFHLSVNQNEISKSYWIWAGITAKDAPKNAELYLYQGLITYPKNDIHYQRYGLYPHPIKNKKLYFVYRLEGSLPEPDMVVMIFKDTLKKWKRHGIIPLGLQIDYDSPTLKLPIYRDFLKSLRAYLPSQYALSITGLGDWANHRNISVMLSITNIVDDIVFQLYSGKRSLKDIDHYIKILQHYQLPFKIGLLPHCPHTQYIQRLRKNKRFKGIVYFIQRYSCEK